MYLRSLATAWKEAEVRPTHRPKDAPVRWWRTRTDPFDEVWPIVHDWLELEPAIDAKQIMQRLRAIDPDAYADNAKLRTLQRKIKRWRVVKARELVTGQLGRVEEPELVVP